MRVLVTGGAGFIGSHLYDAFRANGDEVCVIDDLSRGRVDRLPKDAEIYKESILDATRLSALVAQVEPELICHLAAQVDVRSSVSCPGGDAQVNVIGTINVLDAARAVDARVLFSSTGGALYGEDAPLPSPEDAFPVPGSPYGVSKYCAEQYIGLVNRLFGTEHAILRFANVYGPRQGSSSGEACVISAFCANGIQGKPLTIYGDGRQTRDYVYIDDCVAAILAVAGYGKAGTWNIGTGIETSVADLAALVADLTGNEAQPVFAPARIGELARSALNCERAARDLGWRPATSLADGVQAVIRWFVAGAPDRVSW
jgi:UDP-glucose 4-epimerase